MSLAMLDQAEGPYGAVPCLQQDLQTQKEVRLNMAVLTFFRNLFLLA